jgi:hypothetical protein
LFSLPAGTEMFHFPAFPPHRLYIQRQVTAHNDCRVSPFGHPRITARLTAPRGLSRPPTSFIGSWCQGIHRAPLTTWPQMLASTVQFSTNNQSPARLVKAPPALVNRRPATTRRPCPQTPNSVPDTTHPPGPAFHTPTTQRQYSQTRPGRQCRIVNVPPTSRPPRNTRPQQALCSLERR